MKRKFVIGAISVLTIAALMFTGCGRLRNKIKEVRANNTTQQSSKANKEDSAATAGKDAKNISDSDLMKSEAEDEGVQLDSAEDVSQQLSSEELDTLLNDKDELSDIPTSFNVK